MAFPTSPTEGQTHDDGQQVWEWKNSFWRPRGLSPTAPWDANDNGIPDIYEAAFQPRGSGDTVNDAVVAELVNDLDSTTAAALAGQYAPSVLDEDDFATNSATRPPSQQSVAEYTAAVSAPLSAFVKPIVARALPMFNQYGEVTTADETLNRMNTWVVPVPHPVAISQIGMGISTGGASCTPRLGLYSPAADGSPGELLVDAGTIDASTSGAKIITLGSEVEITTGLVFACVAFQGAVASMRFMRPRRLGGTQAGIGVHQGLSTLLSGALPNAYVTDGVSGALPSTWPGVSSSGQNANIPALFGMTVSALL